MDRSCCTTIEESRCPRGFKAETTTRNPSYRQTTVPYEDTISKVSADESVSIETESDASDELISTDDEEGTIPDKPIGEVFKERPDLLYATTSEKDLLP